MLVAEDLLLLLLDDDAGTPAAASQLTTVLGGAVLAELALAGAVVVGEKQGFWHTAKVVTAGPPPDDDVLRAAHAVVAEKPRSAQDLVGRLGKGLDRVLPERLVARGLLERREHKVLGLFRTTRWPAADVAYEREVRDAVAACLVHGVDPTPRTATLVALLSAVDQAHRTLGLRGSEGRAARQRAKAVAAGQWAPQGVADAVAAANAAVVAAIAASTTAATAASSS